MLSDGILLPKDKFADALRVLAAMGLQKKLLKQLGGKSGEAAYPYENIGKGVNQKFGTGWLQNRMSGVIIDRVIRVYDSLYGDILLERDINPIVLANVAVNYFACYPKDNIGINRMFELILIINSGGSDGKEAQIHIEDAKCTKCNKRYHIHLRLTRKCSACQICEDIKTDNKLLGKLKKEIFEEKGNLMGLRKTGSIVDKIKEIQAERKAKQQRLEKQLSHNRKLAG